MVVTVQPGNTPFVHIDRYRALAQQLGASFALLTSVDVAGAIIQAVRDASAEHVVVGEMVGESRWGRLRPTIVDRIIDGLPHSDIHVIARVAR
jgi:K+-sensing histidine kinase KdpD